MFKQLKKLHKDSQGFTLVELMIVVAIIGILAAIAIPQFAAYRQKGFNASAQSDVKNLQSGEAAFSADWQLYARTGVATTAINTPAATILTGPGTAALNIMAQWASAGNRSVPIAIGNGVTVLAQCDATATSFTLGGKHLQGTTTYGSDSDSSALFQHPTLVAAGTAMAAGNIPASTVNAVNFAAPWVAQ